MAEHKIAESRKGKTVVSMSILIKGQELPTSCGDCMKLFLTEGRNKCPFLWRDFSGNNEYQNKRRMPDCPLVEVPEPHGRLIDADAYILDNVRIIDCDIDHPNYQVTLREVIDDAPTVIEAEE